MITYATGISVEQDVLLMEYAKWLSEQKIIPKPNKYNITKYALSLLVKGINKTSQELDQKNNGGQKAAQDLPENYPKDDLKTIQTVQPKVTE